MFIITLNSACKARAREIWRTDRRARRMRRSPSTRRRAAPSAGNRAATRCRAAGERARSASVSPSQPLSLLLSCCWDAARLDRISGASETRDHASQAIGRSQFASGLKVNRLIILIIRDHQIWLSSMASRFDFYSFLGYEFLISYN